MYHNTESGSQTAAVHTLVSQSLPVYLPTDLQTPRCGYYVVGTTLWVLRCGYYAVGTVQGRVYPVLSCHKEVRSMQEWLTVILTTQACCTAAAVLHLLRVFVLCVV